MTVHVARGSELDFGVRSMWGDSSVVQATASDSGAFSLKLLAVFWRCSLRSTID